MSSLTRSASSGHDSRTGSTGWHLYHFVLCCGLVNVGVCQRRTAAMMQTASLYTPRKGSIKGFGALWGSLKETLVRYVEIMCTLMGVPLRRPNQDMHVSANT